MKFICFGADEEKVASQDIDKKIQNWYKPYKKATKVLLLGTGESGKTTILKQMKILHNKGFSDEERADRAIQIKKNIHEAAIELARNLEPLGLVPGPDSKRAALTIIDCGDSFATFNEEYYDTVALFWSDPVVKECCRRSNEFQLIDSAEYFLDKIESVRRANYIPNDDDILHCRQMTTGIQKIEFKVKVPSSMHGGVQDFWMFDVGGQRGERKKWIQAFEGIHAVWFLIAASDFDQTLREDKSQNRLRESVMLFEDVWKSRFLLEAGLIVFMNKQDILERKINDGRNIGKYFPEYEEFKIREKSSNSDEYTKTKLFIKHLLVEKTQAKKKPPEDISASRRTVSSMGMMESRPRECYYHFTVATNTDNIRTIFNDVHNIILKKELSESGIL